MSVAFLELRNVSKQYAGAQALDRADFALNIGEIHCLVGENGSGKSTLIKVISGVVRPEKGTEILIEGKSENLEHYTSNTSIARGIHVIYQDLSLFPNLTVAENISFNLHVEEGRRIVNWREIKEGAKKAVDEIGLQLDLNRLVGTLSIADQQLVAICRALIGNMRLLIMDEPTSSLTRNEVSALFAVVKRLQLKGITILFVSHKLNEILEIAERVTVFRDGRKIGTFYPNELDNQKLTFHMTGKQISYTKLSTQVGPRQVLLEVNHLSKKGNFLDVSFQLHRGEIMGIIGQLGSGRTELAKALFGMNAPEQGEICIEGKRAFMESTNDAISHGIGFVPENRLVEGLVMPHSVGNNIIITVLKDLLNSFGLFDSTQRMQTVDKWVNDLAIKAPSTTAPVMTLSGGNQQRVVLAKWIATKPKFSYSMGRPSGSTWRPRAASIRSSRCWRKPESASF